MENKSMTPRIRFKGFTDPWEQRKFNSLAILMRGLTYSPSDVVGREQGVRVLRSSNILEDQFVLHDDDVFVQEDVVNIDYSNDGDILITSANGSSRLVGKRAKIAGLPGKTVHGGFMLRAITEEPDFLNAAMGADWYRIFLDVGVSGGNGALGNLDKNALADYFLMVPERDERDVMGTLFSRIDTLITLHQRKYDKLVQTKKSLLDKMFPKPGESVPELRFKGFTDPWEQRKFSDFVVASGIKNRDNLPLQSYSVSNDRGFVPQDEQFENGGTMRDADKNMYWIVEPGFFAYNPARINVGSIGYLSTSENVIVSSLYEVFRADESCDDRFLWHWFKSPLFMKQIEMLQEGGVRLYFFFDKLLLSEIWMPSVEEQRLIGALFSRLDDLITLHQRKLELLKNLKKSLLEGMFV